MDSGVLDRPHTRRRRGGVLSTPEDLAVYSYDATFAEGLPGLVVLPETTEQTAESSRCSPSITSRSSAWHGLRNGGGVDPGSRGWSRRLLHAYEPDLEIDTANATVRARPSRDRDTAG